MIQTESRQSQQSYPCSCIGLSFCYIRTTRCSSNSYRCSNRKDQSPSLLFAHWTVFWFLHIYHFLYPTFSVNLLCGSGFAPDMSYPGRYDQRRSDLLTCVYYWLPGLTDRCCRDQPPLPCILLNRPLGRISCSCMSIPPPHICKLFFFYAYNLVLTVLHCLKRNIG